MIEGVPRLPLQTSIALFHPFILSAGMIISITPQDHPIVSRSEAPCQSGFSEGSHIGIFFSVFFPKNPVCPSPLLFGYPLRFSLPVHSRSNLIFKEPTP
jgi:hypothetical protein